MTANVQEMPRSEGVRAWAAVLELLLGVWLLCLFAIALAWAPIDRRFGPRARRIADRTRRMAAAGEGESGAAYAILPAE